MIYDGLLPRHRRVPHYLHGLSVMSDASSVIRRENSEMGSSMTVAIIDVTKSTVKAGNKPPNSLHACLPACPRVIEMGWTGKAGYYARERERERERRREEGGIGEAFMGKMDDGRRRGDDGGKRRGVYTRHNGGQRQRPYYEMRRRRGRSRRVSGRKR